MKPLSNQQRLHLVNSEQLYENYRAALRHAAVHRYGMRWKTVRGVEYLFRDQDARGNGKSLGLRSAETETTLAAFLHGRDAANERLAGIRAALDEQARLNKALRLARVPRVIARILRELDAAGLNKSFTVLGTQALFGYEAAGGVQFLTELLASGDIDLLYDHRKKITLVSGKLDGLGLLGLLKRADRSFECIRKRGFRAANAGQFMVNLIVPPRGMYQNDPISFAAEDLVAAEVPGLQWLLNAPKIDTVAIDEEGWPTPLRVPDPRAFALHKAWLASRPDRDPVKKPRDLAQAKAVAALVREHMPHLPFSEAISSLHGDVRGLMDRL
ncbi:MAG: nucleotidyltransferase domain-containing protein [Propionivibrio sp.]